MSGMKGMENLSNEQTQWERISQEFLRLDVQSVVWLLGLSCIFVGVRCLFKLFTKVKYQITSSRKYHQNELVLHDEAAIMNKKKEFRSFQLKFIVVYLSLLSVDWLGAPYLYAMYSRYHELAPEIISFLFQASFISTAVASIVVSPFVVPFGRKFTVQISMVTYFLRYLLIVLGTKIGAFAASQVFYGISIVLLYSVPESWMVHEHLNRDFHNGLLHSTYTKMAIGNALLAILVSLYDVAVEEIFGSQFPVYISGMVMCVVSLFLTFLLMKEYKQSSTPDLPIPIDDHHALEEPQVNDANKQRKEFIDEHDEHHVSNPLIRRGSSGGSADGSYRIVKGFKLLFFSCVCIFSSLEVLVIGLNQALYESAMWIFIVCWTPRVKELRPAIVFCSFMIASALGSFVSQIITSSASLIDAAKKKSGEGEVVQTDDYFRLLTGTPTDIMRRPSWIPQELQEPEPDPRIQPTLDLSPQSDTDDNNQIPNQKDTNENNKDTPSSSSKSDAHKTSKILNGLPLRGTVCLYQVVSGLTLLWAAQSSHLPHVLTALILMEFCLGFHFSAFYCLRAQVLPDSGRVIIQNLFGVPPCLINAFLFGQTSRGPSEMLWIGGILCFTASALTALMMLFLKIKRTRSPLNARSNLIVSDNPSSRSEATEALGSPKEIDEGKKRNNSPAADESTPLLR